MIALLGNDGDLAPLVFSDEPGVARNVSLFTMVLGSSRWLLSSFTASQDLQTVNRAEFIGGRQV